MGGGKNSLEYYVQKNNTLKNTFIYKNFIKLYQTHIAQERSELFNIYMKEINDEIKKHFIYKENESGENKETKFVVFDYYGDNEELEYLKQYGIIVIHLNKAMNDSGIQIWSKEFWVNNNDSHPNAKAWQVIVPALVKELDL